MSTTTKLTPLPWQARALSLPETIGGRPLNLFLGGGKGGGKSKLIEMIVIRFCRDYPGGICAITRSRLKSMMALQVELDGLLRAAFGSGVRWNQQTSSFTLPNKSQILLAALDSPQQLGQMAGISLGLLVADEGGWGPDPELLAEMQLNVRTAPMRTIVAANPGQRQHIFWANFIAMHEPWKPVDRDGQLWVNIQTTFRDNTHLDQDAYQAQFSRVRGMDAAKADALELGRWDAISGDFFGSCWSKDLVYDAHEVPLDVFRRPPRLGVDPGSYAPTAVVLAGWTRWDIELKDGRIIPANSFLVHDSHYEYDRLNNNLARGTQRSPSEVAPNILRMCERNGVRARGVIDPAASARVHGRREASAVELYRLCGVGLEPAPRTKRVPGWDTMRALMRDGRFWVASRNVEWLLTVPLLGRAEYDPEDLDSDGIDHLADATRYILISDSPGIGCHDWTEV